MNHKKVILIVLFIVIFMMFAAVMGIAGHIPFLGKVISFAIAAVLIVFVLVFFIFISGGRKK